jgi:S-(hydroxymethyl)glutathione dehydrogenase/alcohol dehydrogenase
MRAAVMTAPNDPLVIETLEPPALDAYEVRLEVQASGVCHSDLSVLQGGVPMPSPLILGHEGAGVVVEVGSAVTRVKLGDRVVTSFSPACGNCWPCLHDAANRCDTAGASIRAVRGRRADGAEVYAMTGLGAFADLMTVHEHQVVPLVTDLPSEQLALVGCAVTTGVGAVLNTAKVEPGATVAVIGCGGVGQAVVQGARIAGAARIIAIDPVEAKRTAAGTFGATDAIDPTTDDVVRQVKALTGRRGADYVFEVIGRPETIVQAYGAARRGGTVVVVGVPRSDASITLPAFPLAFEEKRLLGSWYGSAQVRRDFQRFVDLIEAGRLDVGSMVTRRIALDEVNDAFRAMEAGEVIRSVVV